MTYEIPQHLKQRYFTECKFHHVVNAMENLMVKNTLSPNEMSEALEVAKVKYYLHEVEEARRADMT